MTDYNLTSNIRPILPPIEKGVITPITNIVDFSAQNLDAGDGDTAKVLPIPAGVTVLFCTVLPMADGSGDLAPTNSTVDIGDGTDADQWGAGIVLDTAEYNVATTGGSAVGVAPTYYGTAGYVILTATTDDADVDITAGRAAVTAYCIRH